MYTYKDFQVALNLLPKDIKSKVKTEIANKMRYATSRVMAVAICRISDRELSQLPTQIFEDIVKKYHLDTNVIHYVSRKDKQKQEPQPSLFQEELFNNSVGLKITQLEQDGES